MTPSTSDSDQFVPPIDFDSMQPEDFMNVCAELFAIPETMPADMRNDMIGELVGLVLENTTLSIMEETTDENVDFIQAVMEDTENTEVLLEKLHERFPDIYERLFDEALILREQITARMAEDSDEGGEEK